MCNNNNEMNENDNIMKMMYNNEMKYESNINEMKIMKIMKM